jgi:signal transduction histidine kinase
MDITIPESTLHALIGSHNAGKSTLCRLLAGYASPDAGEVVAGGVAFPGLSPRRAREAGISLVSLPPLVFPRLSLAENLLTGQSRWWLGFSSRRQREKRAVAWLADQGIDLPLERPLRDLPRRDWIAVAILSCLFREPRLLILDQVMEELGVAWQRQLLQLIRRQVRAGMAVLLVTQRIEDALATADSLTVMRRGKAILTGPTGGMERLSLIRLCHDQLENLDSDFATQESFHQLMRYTEAMLNDLPTAVVVLDDQLQARYVNQSGRKLLRGVFSEAVPPFSAPVQERLANLVRRATQPDGTGEGGSLLAIPLAPGREGILVDLQVQAIRDTGVGLGTMLVMEDVSLRESLRRRVALTDKLESIGLLAAGVAHEVNNPLEIIGNYLSFLGGEPLAGDARKALGRMEVEVGRIQRIVNNLVATSGREPQASRVDPVALLRELIELLAPHFRPRGITCQCQEPPEQLFLAVDPGELRQVFLNLIRNSLDALPEAGLIEVAVGPALRTGMAAITFSDNGPGIGLEQPDDVFLPFVTTKKGQEPHQGLGLYVVYGIVERYGGSITVTNQPGGGCCFLLHLPLAGESEPSRLP